MATATAAKTGLSYDGAEQAKSWLPDGNYADAGWGGQPCNPYDTERVPRGTSSGSGVSVSANLVTCSICEQGSASCKGPASRNNIVNFLTTRGLMMHGGMNSQRIGDRAGIHCRTVEDAARVLDAVKGFNSDDMFTAIPQRLMPEEPYASFVVDATQAAAKPLAGMRIGIVREFMVKHTKNDEAISDQLDSEIKAVLRDELGAELVESVDPLYPDDPAVPNMKYTFRDAFARDPRAQRARVFLADEPRGRARGSRCPAGTCARRTMRSRSRWARRRCRPTSICARSAAVSTTSRARSPSTSICACAATRASSIGRASSRTRGSRATSIAPARSTPSASRICAPDDGEMSYLELRIVLQHVVQKVMLENDIDVFVNPENTLPPPKIGGPAEPAVRNRGSASCCQAFTALLGGPEIDVPAGYTQVAYEPQYELSADEQVVSLRDAARCVAAAASDADQPDGLGGPGHGSGGDQGGVGLRGRDRSPRAAAGVRPGADRSRSAGAEATAARGVVWCTTPRACPVRRAARGHAARRGAGVRGSRRRACAPRYVEGHASCKRRQGGFPNEERQLREGSIRGLRAFCAAARHLSFKAAAEELCVTPSAVSHQVKALEERLQGRSVRTPRA